MVAFDLDVEFEFAVEKEVAAVVDEDDFLGEGCVGFAGALEFGEEVLAGLVECEGELFCLLLEGWLAFEGVALSFIAVVDR